MCAFSCGLKYGQLDRNNAMNSCEVTEIDVHAVLLQELNRRK
jgi:hypothetical protein